MNKTTHTRLYIADNKAAVTETSKRVKAWDKKRIGPKPIVSDIIKEWHEASRKESK